MVGIILFFDKETNEGEILGVDDNKYYFHIGEWLSYHPIKIGQEVNYEVKEDLVPSVLNIIKMLNLLDLNLSTNMVGVFQMEV